MLSEIEVIDVSFSVHSLGSGVFPIPRQKSMVNNISTVCRKQFEDEVFLNLLLNDRISHLQRR